MRNGWRSGWSGDDQFWQRDDFGNALDVEPVAEIVEERDAKFLAGLHQSEKDITRVAARFGPCAAGDFALGDMAADVVLRAVGMQRDLGPFEDAQELGFPGCGRSASASSRYPASDTTSVSCLF